MLIPPPVKFSALLAVLFEAMPQLGALMFGLPWKLIEPVNAKTHGFASFSTLATACALIVTLPSVSLQLVLKSTNDNDWGWHWVTVSLNRIRRWTTGVKTRAAAIRALGHRYI